MEEFTGKLMHSAAWDGNFDLTGKTVAVIGGGSSAVQIVPNIQPGIYNTHLKILHGTHMSSCWKIDTLPTIIGVDYNRLWCKICRSWRN